jgi:Cu/Zn superoxide dismutase
MRWRALAVCSLVGSLLACSEESSPGDGGGGMPTAGTGGNSGGGSGGAGGKAGSGSGGSSAGMGTSGSAGTPGMGGGGAGGSGGGGAGGDGGSGGAKADATAEAVLNPTGGNTITGKATFEQTGTTVKMTMTVMNCPTGKHAMHLHMNKDCGNNGEAAGTHWVPNGEKIGDVDCGANMMGTHTHVREADDPQGAWTIGGNAATDITKYSMVVHEASDVSPGGRIACGLVNTK